MNFEENYSYGYDQINTQPARHVNYDDSEYILHRNSQQTPLQKQMQQFNERQRQQFEFARNPPGGTPERVQKEQERKQIQANIEDLLRPDSGVKCTDNMAHGFAEQLKLPGNHPANNQGIDSFSSCPNCPKSCANDCPPKKECCPKGCSKLSSMMPDCDSNMFLLILVFVLTALCAFQYINAQNMNSTLLGLLKPRELKTSDLGD